MLDFKDVNECDTGNNTCRTEQVCFNFQGGYTCLNPLQCQLPYIIVSDKWVVRPPFITSQHSLTICLIFAESLNLPMSTTLQSVHVCSWEPCLQGLAFHHSVPTHGLVVGARCACRHLPDAGHHALPRRLLHLPDQVGQHWSRVLHEGEHSESMNRSEGNELRCIKKEGKHCHLLKPWKPTGLRDWGIEAESKLHYVHFLSDALLK